MARPKKQVQEGEKDDQPTYVVEDSQETMSIAEYEAFIAANDADRQSENYMPSSAEVHNGVEEAEFEKNEVTREAALVKQQVAGIGGSTKRRLAKIIGDEEQDEAAPGKSDSAQKDKKIRAKKGKRMKLSFDEEGTEV